MRLLKSMYAFLRYSDRSPLKSARQYFIHKLFTQQSIVSAAAGTWDKGKQNLLTWADKYCEEMDNVDNDDSDYELDSAVAKKFEISFDFEIVGSKDTSTLGSVETVFTSVREAVAKNTRSARSCKSTGATLKGSTNSLSSTVRSSASSVAMSSNKSITSGILDASITKQFQSMNKLEIMTELRKLLNQPTAGSNSRGKPP
jgi:hypothetical protein